MLLVATPAKNAALLVSPAIEKTEVPHDEPHQGQGAQINQVYVPRHQRLPGREKGSKNLSRFALLTTVTELKAMAAPAITGERRIPNTG